MGARVLAGVSNAAKAPAVLAAGADDFIDLSQPNLRDSLREQVFAKNGGKGVDIVIDPIGGDAFDAALRALAWRGRLVVIGFASGRIPEVKANYLLVKNIEVTGLQVSDYRKRMPAMMADCMHEIFALYEAGKLKPAPFQSVPLDAFATSLQDIVDRRGKGRVVLEPNP
jgi:NADPH2:quinone reductase